ncbi:MAG TPA: hypothetical protein VGI86_03440, partial [Acidimicrobiia bacterium]
MHRSARSRRRRRGTRAGAGVLAIAFVTAIAGLCSPALGASPRAAAPNARSAVAATSADPDALVSDEAVPPADANSPAAKLPAASLPVRSSSPAVIGQWSAPFTPGNAVTAVHMVLLDTGKVLEWTMHYVKLPGDSYQSLQAIASVYDPVTRKAKRVDPPIDNNI